ncbi:MAG: sigma-70 family RNA polymerase sigma factor [Bryobacteraceae bacterium]
MQWETFDQPYVDKLIEGNSDVERHFTHYFGELLEVKLRSRVRSPQVREDLVQETFLRTFAFLRKKGSLEHPERLGAFVNTVCQNVLLEYYRGASRINDLPEHMSDPPDSAEDSESRLVSEERKNRVRQVLAELPEKDQTILRSIFLEERDKDDICREMNVDREYLRVLLHRAKGRFRDHFTKGKAAAMALLNF